MVGFWATMSLSIADITRYSSTQKEQVMGQLIGLPGTMMLYSFVGIFVSCASVIIFKDILVGNDAPWDPVSLLAKFDNPVIVVIAQVFMIIATLSTNIAANVIAPANAFSNLNPKKIPFRFGGLITGIIGILICPWILMDEISNILIFVSGLFGPILGIMLSDYFLVRKTELPLAEFFKENGAFRYHSGFNVAAMIALIFGVFVALIGYFVPALDALYKLSWFSGFLVSFVTYYLLMKKNK
jgi:NCS1 nucleoside transporter family